MRRFDWSPRGSLLFFAMLLMPVVACGGDGSAGDDDMVGDDDCATCTDPDASPGEPVWVPLITGDWTLAPGTENTGDNHQIILNRDVYVGGIRPISPLGTHHTVFGFAESSAGIIYASGVGTNAVMFPEGVGLKLPAGSHLNLQLHIFNVTEQQLSGTSGIEIVEVAPDAIVQEADLFLPGPFTFSLPPGQETTASGTCTVQTPYSIFALFPHMHQLGRHFKTTVNVGGVDQVLHDDTYRFDEQAFDQFEPIAMNPGDTIRTECTWFNDTNGPVSWGESSNAEMCFSILYRFPAAQNEFCSN